MPQTTTTTGGAGTSRSAAAAPPAGHSPSGPNWYPINPSGTLASYGYFPPLQHPMGTPGGYMVPPLQHPMGTPAGYMGPPLQHPMGTPVGLSMPTPEVHTDQSLQDDHSDPHGHTDSEPLSFGSEDEQVVVDPDGRRRKVIYPFGDAFVRSKTASSAITYVIKKLYFEEYHEKVTKIDKRKKKDFVDLFRMKVTWRLEDDELVHTIFWTRFAKQLADLLYKLRRKNERPRYIPQEVWDQYQEVWRSQKFKANAGKAKENRNSEKGGSLHTCGSVNKTQHAMRLSKKVGRPLTIAELHRATHVRKDTQTYVDERSRTTQEKHAETMFEPTQGSWNPESLGPMSLEIMALANRNWEKLVGGMYKKRMYGTGPLAPNLRFEDDLFDTSGPSSSSRPPRPPGEIEQLRQQMEEMRAQHQQQIQEMHAQHQQKQQKQSRTMKDMQTDFLRFGRQEEKLLKYSKSMKPDASKFEES